MTIFFSIKEGIKGLARARMATFLTITTVTLALMLIGIFITLFVNIDHWVVEKRKTIEIEVFLEPVLEEAQIQSLIKKVEQLQGVESVVYISRKQAAERFKREFGQDVESVLGTNPLPPSLILKLTPIYRNAQAIAQLSKNLQELDGVSEVVYAAGILQLIDRYVTIIYLILGSLGLVLIVITVILIHNSIRLIIYARREIIEIMELVGATRGFIRMPYLVEGIIYGLFGGILASGVLFVLIYAVRHWLFSQVIELPQVYALILVLGLLIGFVSSKSSVNKHLKNNL